MVLSTVGLDHHLARLEDMRRREREVTGYITRDLGELTAKIRDGETTGVPLRDWALLAHGPQYRENEKQASLLQQYLVKHQGGLVLFFQQYPLDACNVERSPAIDHGDPLHLPPPPAARARRQVHVGVIGEGGINVVRVSDSLGLVFSLDRIAGIYYEEAARQRVDKPYVTNSRMQQGLGSFPAVETLLPFTYHASGFWFNANDREPPYLSLRLQAGTQKCLETLRHYFWGAEKLPDEARSVIGTRV